MERRTVLGAGLGAVVLGAGGMVPALADGPGRLGEGDVAAARALFTAGEYGRLRQVLPLLLARVREAEAAGPANAGRAAGVWSLACQRPASAEPWPLCSSVAVVLWPSSGPRLSVPARSVGHMGPKRVGPPEGMEQQMGRIRIEREALGRLLPDGRGTHTPYQQAFDAIAVSHRGRPVGEILPVLRRAADSALLEFTAADLREQATAISTAAPYELRVTVT
ncbi:hypothetical protein ACFCY8_11395 [Streptomyces noursei]|uniref:hypothetical protein n=1 Tax=Streptomyces noursei TaxID=1971 RepID=UPI0035DC1855